MTPHLSTPDLLLVAIYFVALGWVSRKLGGHGTTTRSYLLGDGNIPWWAVMLSILGSEISALTFVGVPALAYTGNWTYLQMVGGAILARYVVARWFVPAYYRQNVTSIYEFLLVRFGPNTRNLAAVLFLVARVLMSGVRLYAGALIAQVALGVSPIVGICLLAAIGFLYTIAGGIQAVIWTEVIQVIVMFTGALAALGMLLVQGGSWEGSSLQVIDLSTNPALEFTLWTSLIGSTFSNTAIFGTDYDMVQRMLTAQDSKRSARAVIVSGFASIPVSALFLAIGTGLAAYYRTHPDPLIAGAKVKEVFPLFIVTKMPVGLAGLVVAAVLSVVLSSFESALNALAGSFVMDLYRPYRQARTSKQKNPFYVELAGPSDDIDDARLLKVTRVAMAGFALALVGMAIYSQSIEKILQFGLEIGTYCYGALLAVFAVGLFTKGGDDRACALSIPFAIAAVVLLKLNTALAFPWFVMAGTATGMGAALLISGVSQKAEAAPHAEKIDK